MCGLTCNFNFTLFMHISDNILYKKCVSLCHCSTSDGLCRPIHMGEITMPQQIVINEYICASNWNKHNIICD